MTMIEKVTVPEGTRGPWAIERFTVSPEAARLEMIRAMFTRDRRAVPSGTYTRLRCGGCVVMSDTPDEMNDHIPIIRCARDHVMITGLGLGMIVAAVLKKPDVKTVTVVELDQDVIDLVAPHYVDPRLTIVQGDAMTWKPPRAVRYGAIWHDIWSDICKDHLQQMTTLKRRFARCSDWQGCWSENYIRRLHGMRPR